MTLDKYMKVVMIKHNKIINSSIDDNYLCPYCGYVDRLIEFRYIRKKGEISKNLCKCKRCENIFKLRTLKIIKSIPDWCKWLYYNIRIDNYGKEFFNKIKWDLLKHHLNLYGIANDFWNTWKQVKKEYNKEESNRFFNNLYKSQSKRVSLNSFDTDKTVKDREIGEKEIA
jgi:hypothetical protein